MINNFIIFFTFILIQFQTFKSYAVEFNLNEVQEKIDDIKAMDVMTQGSPEFLMFQVLQNLTTQLNSNKKSKSLVQDTLTVLDITDFIEEKFPQVTKLQFPENFLVGSNLTVADLTNASFFLNSLNSRRLEKLKKLSDLSQGDSILSKINTQIVEELSLEPLKLIQQLEKMPKLDLVSLSTSVNEATSSILKNTEIVTNNLNEITSTASNAVVNATAQVESATTTLSRAAGAAMAAASYSLDQAASEVANTISAGVSVDLDAAAQGLGHDDFAAAVDAYNAQYGTNYTVDSAKEALGQ
jgi:hypothetical protein